jgi:RNA polymerase sigma factor (sigma-70 family)
VKRVRVVSAVGETAASERVTVGPAEARRDAALRLIDSHDAVFRRTARRYSICADDAEDAYQRALEILLTKAPPIDGDALVRWMQVVTKREALAVHRQRDRLLNGPRAAGDEDPHPLDSIASESPQPTDRAESRERVARSGEALRALKPQEIRALTLKAQGYSYKEIGEITGWSYTKINRCMAEGRKRFLEVFAEIEEGRRCDRLAAALSMVADGESQDRQADQVHSHLRSCASCRAKLRAFRAIPERVFDLAPSGPALDLATGGRPHEWIAERIGAAVEKTKQAGYSLLNRGAEEGASQVLPAGGTKGAGMAGLAKVLAVCGATAAGGATCVATNVVSPADIGIGGKKQGAVVEQPAPAPAPDKTTSASRQPAAAPARAEAATSAAEPVPAAAAAQEEVKRQFSFEQTATKSSGGTSGGGSEFGGPSGGGGSSGGSGGGGGGGFTFEK